jgi:hypothetical protein
LAASQEGLSSMSKVCKEEITFENQFSSCWIMSCYMLGTRK